MNIPNINVLVVDDDAEIIDLLRSFLSRSTLANYSVANVSNSADALQGIDSGGIDLCIIDQNLNSDLTGVQVIQRVCSKNPHFPMILLTGESASQLDHQALEAGAAGFIHKEDLTATVLDRTIRYAIARFVQIRALADETLTHKRLSLHDPLTGLPNRREYEYRLERAISNATHDHNELALIYIDLNKFKSINDRYGHDVGDHVLQIASTRLSNEFRSQDVLCRVGGDEFIAIVTDVRSLQEDDRSYSALIERLGVRLDPVIQIGRKIIHISASFGVAKYPEHGTNAVDLTKAADSNMYRQKRRKSSAA